MVFGLGVISNAACSSYGFPEKWIKLLLELLSGEQLRQFFDSVKQKNEKKLRQISQPNSNHELQKQGKKHFQFFEKLLHFSYIYFLKNNL